MSPRLGSAETDSLPLLLCIVQRVKQPPSRFSSKQCATDVLLFRRTPPSFGELFLTVGWQVILFKKL